MPRIPPPEVVASWPKPNYNNPSNRGHYLIAVEVALFSLTAIIVSGRIYTRRWLIRSFGVDDWLILAAAILCLALTVSTCLATTAGYGLHIYDVPHEVRTKSLEYAWANMLIYCLTISLTKLSILFFYLRLVPSGLFRTATYVTIFVVVSTGVAYVFTVIFYCVPIKAYWKPYDWPDAKCSSDGDVLVSNAAVNIALDCWLWIMPVPIVWGLRLPTRQKVGLVGVFALGFFVCLAGALRLYYVAKTAYSYDKTWDGFSAWIWTAAESDVGIICASLPALKPLITKLTNFKFSEVTPSVYGNSRSRTLGNRKSALNTGGIRLPSRAASRTLGPRRNPMDSIWDGSDEVICERDAQGRINIKKQEKAGVYQMSTVIFSGDPDGKLANARKSYFFERGLSSKENLTVQVRPFNYEDSSDEINNYNYTKDIDEARRSDEKLCMNPDWRSCWEVMRTTEIEVREDHSFDEPRNESSLSIDSLGRRGADV
ncbi:hypothetical protein H072_8297 [Dactylellina haptotyla CBS 200.50]|uniref:Rhodopsin domain-containing protein n=1 Tax=Dactylellina haptotyla (strain CBS 200.50) TaxID=1284197 RepID=S8BFB9_DACHA|nr:hypothetical protein H072_8297 [Dactylellina haptotyla CBS 200.50]